MASSRHILLSLLLFSLVISCTKEVEKAPSKPLDPDKVPMMVTHNVKTLISDSGTTQYRITTPVWYVYDGGEKPRWNFPEGAYLEQFDKKFNVIATVRCDSAMYDTRMQLWRLDGNVRIQNVNKELILTNQLFWDQRWQEVRSDSFIHIERIDRVIEGYGFKSNQNLTKYQINRVMAILPVDESRMAGNNTAQP
ncbi:MAG: LPS export ABC transporter periplasmic protein LptC [Bacteroidales bacterium]|nr:LPS export ABC transporter periplasmic protein LptC [Bacteroidales bacterium]